MNTLQTIQTISKIGKIISKIVFICCIVGFCLCIVGLVGTATGMTVIKLGGVTLESYLQNAADVTTGTLYATLATGAVMCVGQGVLARFALHYFERELADGTPFTVDGANELMRLGVLSICIPIGIQIGMQIAQKIVEHLFTQVEPLDADPAVSVAVGALVLIMALICKYGAQQSAAVQPPDQ